MTEYLTKKDKKRVESFLRVGEEIVLGKVRVDPGKCTGCGFCVHACAASALEVVDLISRMVEELPQCIGCGDCVAICPEQAISLEGFIQFNGFFRFLDRGKPMLPRKF